MASLAQRLADLATRIAQEFGAVRTEANGAITEAAFTALAAANGLKPGKTYMLSDVERVAVALTASTFAVMSKASVTLGALTLTGLSVAENSANGTVVGAVSGKATGSTVTLTDTAGGRFSLSGNNLVVAGAIDYEAAHSYNVTLRETNPEGINSPRDTVITIAITDDTSDNPILVNGNFATNTDWTLTGNGLSITGGALVAGAGSGQKFAKQLSGQTLVQGATYAYSITQVARGFGSIALRVGTDTNNSGGTQAVNLAGLNGTYSGTFDLATLTGQYIYIVGSSSSQWTIDDVQLTRILSPLTLTSTSVAEDAAIGAAVGTLGRTFTGATRTLQDNAGGQFSLVGDELRVAAALDYETTTSYSVTVRETKAGLSNSPRDTVFTITVTNVLDGTLGPELNPDPGFNNPGLWSGYAGGGGEEVPTVTGGKAVFTNGGQLEIATNDTLDPGVYRVAWTIESITGECEVVLGGGGLPSTIARSATGSYLEDVDGRPPNDPPGSDTIRIATSGIGFAAVIDNISVKRVTFP